VVFWAYVFSSSPRRVRVRVRVRVRASVLVLLLAALEDAVHLLRAARLAEGRWNAEGVPIRRARFGVPCWYCAVPWYPAAIDQHHGAVLAPQRRHDVPTARGAARSAMLLGTGRRAARSEQHLLRVVELAAHRHAAELLLPDHRRQLLSALDVCEVRRADELR